MRGHLRVYEDHPSLIQAATDFVVELGKDAINSRGVFTLALSGGSTPKALYKRLSESSSQGRIDWSATYLFWGDERTVPLDDADSNYHMVRENLIDQIPIPPEQVFRIRGEASPQPAAETYHKLLDSSPVLADNVSHCPRFDLILLGMGEDGHTASLFPDTSALEVQDRWVVANYVEKLDSWRITLTFPVLNNARTVVFLVSGEAKASMLAQVVGARAGPDRFPAQRIHPEMGQLVWFVDQAATSAL
jgi:6-phosphogluconolactonase